MLLALSVLAIGAVTIFALPSFWGVTIVLMQRCYHWSDKNWQPPFQKRRQP
jgi:hypothetical protein